MTTRGCSHARQRPRSSASATSRGRSYAARFRALLASLFDPSRALARHRGALHAAGGFIRARHRPHLDDARSCVRFGVEERRGGGVDAAPSVMETSGPFAALAKRKAERESQGGVSEVTVSAGPTPAAKAAADAPPAPAPSAASDASNGWGVAVNDLDWSYPGIDGSRIAGSEPLIKGMDLKLKPGSCCLLLGANGAGKTTLLKILGGKHMVPKDKVLIHGREAFYDTSLTTSGQLSYIGGDWQRDVAFAGYGVTLAGDFPASKMLDSIPGVDPERKKRIIDVLDINPEWRMHQVSDGQRRRVQLAYGLMIPYSVLLLDEITVDLDVLGRADLMAFLRRECEERSVTIVYATHIFDGLEEFATHVAFVAGGGCGSARRLRTSRGSGRASRARCSPPSRGGSGRRRRSRRRSSQSAGSSRRRCSSTRATADGERGAWPPR